MSRKYLQWGLIVLLVLAVTACGSKNESSPPATSQTAESSPSNGGAPEQPKQSAPADQTRTIRYLDQDYTVPAKPERLVITGSLEAMEDALVLGVKPVGAMTVGGKFPKMFEEITDAAEPIGEKAQPNVETILKLKPDIILSTTKFPPDVSEKLVKIAPAIPVSHISTNWEANLRLLAELTGKQEQAEQAIKQYKDDVAAAKTQLGETLKD